jgi:hypothetical protein
MEPWAAPLQATSSSQQYGYLFSTNLSHVPCSQAVLNECDFILNQSEPEPGLVLNQCEPTRRLVIERRRLGSQLATIRFSARYSYNYLASRETQREIQEGLNVVENWNATNDFLCYGRQGELATNSREQQEIVTLSLQLLQNCLMLVNTILIERTLAQDGLWGRMNVADRRGLTPLFHGHINPYGQFPLDLTRPSFLEAA